MRMLFIHGLASSGRYKMADGLRNLFAPCEVIAPDVPEEPEEALAMLKKICKEEQPDLIVGLSLGGFWAQMLRGYRKILINPGFHVSGLLRRKLGRFEYMSPRADGAEFFEVTPALCDSYERIEAVQFDGISETDLKQTTGLFAIEDEVVRCLDEFDLHYPGRSYQYHGGHLPNYPEIKALLPGPVAQLMKEN